MGGADLNRWGDIDAVYLVINAWQAREADVFILQKS